MIASLLEKMMIATMGIFLLGGLFSFLFGKTGALSRILGSWSVILGSFLGLGTALGFLISQTSFTIQFFTSLPFPFNFSVDFLSSVFLFLIFLVSLSIGLYSLGYLVEYEGKYHLGVFGFKLNLLLLSMVFLVCSGDGVTFLMAWESMTLLSYLLVSTETDKPESVHAGNLFLVISHIGTAFIFISFLALFSFSGSMGFSDFKSTFQDISPFDRNLVFICFLIGFGTKAGVIPFHIWLPVAHPAAPSNISSLMSGIIIKMGIYGFARFYFDVLGIGPAWWGGLILFLASISAVLGVMYALMEHDLKRLLAFHSIENIGIILIGFGTALIFKTHGLTSLSALAFLAGLYHTLNHAVFKGLLFLGAGAVVSAVHSRDMEKMGGLIKRMPTTAFFFLIGSLSISALPPFNGFISEWLIFQSLLLSLNLPEGMGRILIPLSGAMLALTGALAAACFVKAFGLTFLAMPRSPQTQQAKEAPISMKLGMGILAMVCLLFGIFPGFVIFLLDGVVLNFMGVHIFHEITSSGGWMIVPVYQGFSSLSPGVLLMILCSVLLALFLIVLIFLRDKKITQGETWACGIHELTPKMEYTPTGFSNAFRQIFSNIYQPRHEIKQKGTSPPYVTQELLYSGEIEHLIEKYLYKPLLSYFLKIGEKIKVIQSGSIHAYLAYLFLTLVAGLIYLTVSF
jgi:hydrogenase-4 component B